jgi:hypothetical protein
MYHSTKKIFPLIEGKMLFILFPDEVWRRPYTQGNAVWFYVRQKLASVAAVDVVWLEEIHVATFWMICAIEFEKCLL